MTDILAKDRNRHVDLSAIPELVAKNEEYDIKFGVLAEKQSRMNEQIYHFGEALDDMSKKVEAPAGGN